MSAEKRKKKIAESRFMLPGGLMNCVGCRTHPALDYQTLPPTH